MEQQYHTPWGRAWESDRTEVAPGIDLFSTESHGGYRLSDERLKKVHPGWGHEGRWFEEDIEWVIVVLTFPEHFDERKVEEAHKLAKEWLPDQYAAALGVEVKPEESHILMDRALRQGHEHDWEVKSRFGSWAENVPEGHVGLVLRKGGEERCILVSKEVDHAHRLRFGLAYFSDLAFFTDEEVSTFPAWDWRGAYGTVSP